MLIDSIIRLRTNDWNKGTAKRMFVEALLPLTTSPHKLIKASSYDITKRQRGFEADFRQPLVRFW